MISLTINGKEVACEEGRTVLEAAREAGFSIPTLCHHESLPPYGSCRFCMVEVKQGRRTRLYTSCTLPAADGMVIQTHTDRVLKIRRMLVELMLARCPESPVLHDLANEIGVGHCRFDRIRGVKSPCRLCQACKIVEEMRMKTPDGVPSTFVGRGGCILCGMCVRLCDDVMKIGALAFEGRGARRHVTTPFREPSEFCITCGACSSICPTGAIELFRIRPDEPRPIPSEFEMGLTTRKPIYLSFPQAVPRVPVIDKDTCVNFQTDGCKICEDNCERDAIDHTAKDVVEEVEVGAIILTTGFKTFDPTGLAYYGYGRYPNVYTSLEVERLVNASGPTGGDVVLRDSKKPKTVGIVHCVGSRDENTNPWCSRVCCMYSLKLAHLVKEKTGAEVFNFYIDIRSPGKSMEEFYKRVSEEGVQMVRGRVADVYRADPKQKDGPVVVQVEDTLTGQQRRIPVDMLILSVGLEPDDHAPNVRRLFSITCSTEGFFMERHPKLAPVDTFTDGIYLAGCCQGPKDIPDTVAQAGAAAAQALALIDRGFIELEPNTAYLTEENCSGCKSCIPLCPYSAIGFEEEKHKAAINEALCKGCGTCVAACPSGSIHQNLFEDEQIFGEIDELLAPP